MFFYDEDRWLIANRDFRDADLNDDEPEIICLSEIGYI